MEEIKIGHTNARARAAQEIYIRQTNTAQLYISHLPYLLSYIDTAHEYKRGTCIHGGKRKEGRIQRVLARTVCAQQVKGGNLQRASIGHLERPHLSDKCVESARVMALELASYILSSFRFIKALLNRDLHVVTSSEIVYVCVCLGDSSGISAARKIRYIFVQFCFYY